MKKALVIFSGGQDSTTCLVHAIAEYGRENVETISFDYGQRHSRELEKARWIAADLQVLHTVINTSVLQQTTHSSLIDTAITIAKASDSDYPNTFVEGRNVLFLLLAACHAKQKDIHDIIIGVSQTDYSGYPDCRDTFIKSMNVTLNLAMDYAFVIKTPLMYLTKEETWALADTLGYLDYIDLHTHTCYIDIAGGCHACPSCLLREKGLTEYLERKNNKETAK